MDETKQRAAATADEKATAAAERVRKYVADVPGPELTDAERMMLEPPPRVPVSEWTERYRVVKRSSRPGPWRNSTQPALKPIMDLSIREWVRELWIEKATQLGGSEVLRNYLAYRAHVAPCAALLVLPNARDGRKLIKKYWRPLLNGTEVAVLAPFRSPRKSDNTMENIALLNGHDVQLGFSGSASSLASEPREVVLLDEVNKFEPWDGGEASATDLARTRMKTFPNRKLLACSSPTDQLGEISERVEKCDIILVFFISCPSCATEQRLVFEQIKWKEPDPKQVPDPHRRASYVRAHKAAWYECVNPACQHRMTDATRIHQIEKGYWAPVDQSWKLYCDGREEGTPPSGTTIGVRLHGLASTFLEVAEVAAKWIGAQGQPKAIQDIKNSDLGEVFHLSLERLDSNVFSRKCRPSEDGSFVPVRAGLVPRWASRVLMTVDTQLGHFYWLLRAWGYGKRSARLAHGKATSLEQLEEILYHTSWRYEDDPATGKPAFEPLPVWVAGIDSGGGFDPDKRDSSLTEMVYRWCAADPRRRIPLKGMSRPMEVPMVQRWHEYTPQRQGAEPVRVYLLRLDSLYWRDLLKHQITQRVPDVDFDTGEVRCDPDGRPIEVDVWQLNDLDDPEYNRHLSAMHEVVNPKTKKRRYVPLSEGARHDFHDLETYQQALAHHNVVGAMALPSFSMMRDMANASRPRKPVAIVKGGVSTPDGRPYLANKR